MKTNRRENAVSAGVHAYLDMRTDVYFWRNQTGGAKFNDFFVKFGINGAADFIGVQAPSGRFFGVECKREKGGKVSDDQIRWGANLIAHGGLYIVATDVDTVAKALGPVRAHVVKFSSPRVVHR